MPILNNKSASKKTATSGYKKAKKDKTKGNIIPFDSGFFANMSLAEDFLNHVSPQRIEGYPGANDDTKRGMKPYLDRYINVTRKGKMPKTGPKNSVKRKKAPNKKKFTGRQ